MGGPARTSLYLWVCVHVKQYLIRPQEIVSSSELFVCIFVMNPFPIEFRNWVLFLNLSVDIRNTHLMSLLTIMMLFSNFQTLSVSVVITPWRNVQDSSRTHLFWRKNNAMVFAPLT